MLYRLPFTFTALSIKKGHRKMEPHVFGDWALVEIPHVTSEDAPVSMRWQSAWTNRQVTHEARWFEGSNWAPAIPRDARVPTPDYTHEDLARLKTTSRRENGFSSHLLAYAKATGQDFGNLNRFLTGHERDPSRVTAYDPESLKRIERSDRQQMHDRLVQEAANLLFIDGLLWVGGKEPCYAVHGFNEGGITIQNSASDIPDNWIPSSNNFFRADRLDDAIDFASEKSDVPATVPFRIEVLMPEAVLFDDEAFSIRRSARWIVDNTFENMKDAPAEAVRAWLRLREATEPEEAAEAMAEIQPHLQNESHLQVAETALRRWDFRPIEAEVLAL